MTNQPDEAPRFRSRPPTALLREIIDVTDEFEAHVGRELSVNPTDLQAMEHLIMSGPLSPTELARRLGISTAAVTAVVDPQVNPGAIRGKRHIEMPDFALTKAQDRRRCQRRLRSVQARPM